MNQSKIAVRYAKAFFELAQEKNQLDELKNDVETIAKVCGQKDIVVLLESPVVKTSQKKALFRQIFKNSVNDISLRFVLMVTDNKRENHLGAICRNFIAQYRTQKGVKAANVTTATAIDDSLKQKIGDIISKVFKTDVELTVSQNPNLLGGFVLRVGDEQIDASIATKLNNIKRDFLSTTI